MAYKLPDGALVSIATNYVSSSAVSALTNANPAVATYAGSNIANGDIFVLTSGWSRLNNRPFRAAGVSGSTFQVEGVDTTDTSVYPAGGGIGAVVEANTFVQIPQILTFDTQGGDQQFTTFSFLEDNFERQLPTVFSAQSINITMAYDTTTPGYQAALSASRKRSIVVVQLALPDGTKIFFNGYISVNETPTLTKGSIMQSKVTLTLVGLPTQYAT